VDRTLHIICGGHNAGKSVFSRYLQIGKKNIYRLCFEEIAYTIGVGPNQDKIFYQILLLFLNNGDTIIEGVRFNSSEIRKKAIAVARSIANRVIVYAVKRPVEQCHDDDYTKEEVEASHIIQYPRLNEGVNKIISVSWINSTEPVTYGDEALMVKPELATIYEVENKSPIVVKSKKNIIKRKLERNKRHFMIGKPKKNG